MLRSLTLFLACCGLSLALPRPNAQSPKFPRLADSAPNPEPCTGNCSWIHDPSVIVKDGTYYRFSTSGNIAIATAPSLTGPWTYQGAMLDHGTSIHLTEGQDTWAPDVSLVGDTYYAFYAVSQLGFQGSQIGVATSKSLHVGTWTDLGSMNIPQSSAYNLIDPNLFQENGALYLSFGSYWQDIFQTELSSPPVPTSSKCAPINLAFNSTNGAGSTAHDVIEGSFQFKFDDKYYLFFSSGPCCNAPPNLAPKGDEYHVEVCRADGIEGPYLDAFGNNCLTQNGGTLVLASHDQVYAPGGQGVMVDPASNRPVLYYHYVNPSVGYHADQYLFGFNYLDFSSGWPVMVS